MSVDAISFSAHADFPQTSEFLDLLKPPHVVLVHGEAGDLGYFCRHGQLQSPQCALSWQRNDLESCGIMLRRFSACGFWKGMWSLDGQILTAAELHCAVQHPCQVLLECADVSFQQPSKLACCGLLLGLLSLKYFVHEFLPQAGSVPDCCSAVLHILLQVRGPESGAVPCSFDDVSGDIRHCNLWQGR